MSDYYAVVLRVDKWTLQSIIWKVVATEEMAKSFVEKSDENYQYRYEMWRISGRQQYEGEKSEKLRSIYEICKEAKENGSIEESTLDQIMSIVNFDKHSL